MFATAVSDTVTTNTWATGVNSAGVVVGYITLYSGYGPTLPVRWNANGTIDTLLTLDPRGGWANAVNDLGEIVGCSYFPLGEFSPVVWMPTGEIQRLDSTASMGCAYGISSNGTYIVGQLNGHAFRLKLGERLRDLGTLGGSYIDNSLAWGVNKFGEVVGQSSDSTGALRAFTWYEPGIMRALPNLPSGFNSVAYAVNDSGQVVGWSDNYYGERATTWYHGNLIDLATVGAPNDQAVGLYSQARAVSPFGLIAGFQAHNTDSLCNGGICAALWRVKLR
jgi:probable HAF family extracellular repeat protein